MKPDVTTAMRNLIEEARSTLPFDMSEAQMCSDSCQGCSKKLLEFVDMELDEWEHKLNEGTRPNFADIHRMGKICHKVYNVLLRNGLIENTTPADDINRNHAS